MPHDLHVLHLISSAGLYGAEHVVLGLIPALAHCNVDSTLACIDNPHLREQPLYELATARGIHAVRVPCAGRFDRRTIHNVRRQLASRTNTIVHVHGYKSAFYALRARGRGRTPIVATLHGWVTTTIALRCYRLLELWMLRRCQGVCIVSDAMRRPLLEAGIQTERIRLIENGIDTMRFRADADAMSRESLGIPDDAFVFGGVLRLSAEKNPLGLINAFAQVTANASHAQLVIAGDGPQRAETEQRIRAHNIGSHVHLLGARKDPERLYPMFDCFVLPSLTEGLPLSLLEAMAAERPIIASDVGQVASVLMGLPSHLVHAGDTNELAAAMRDSLATRPPLAAARRRVEARYSTSRMATEYAALYRELEAVDVRQAA